MSYSRQTGLVYVPVQEVGATATRRRREFKESIPYWGAGVAVDLEDYYGYVAAIDPVTGEESFVYSCYNQDQPLDHVDFPNLRARLRQNSVQEKLSNLWLDHLLNRGAA